MKSHLEAAGKISLRWQQMWLAAALNLWIKIRNPIRAQAGNALSTFCNTRFDQ